MKKMKVALVCDWLTNVGGAEKVLLEIHKMFPEAPIYTSKYDKKGINWFLDADVRTGWLQIFPTVLRRFLGPLRQRWFLKLDLSEYDLVISVTGAEAKSVKVPNGVHVSYCHVPTQYYWQMYDDYVKNPGFGFLNPIVRGFPPVLTNSTRLVFSPMAAMATTMRNALTCFRDENTPLAVSRASPVSTDVHTVVITEARMK